MNNLASLIGRNMKIFYRTKGNIIFGSLSVIILIVLHFIIFRDMYSDNWTEVFSNFPNGDFIPENDVKWLVDSLMFSTIIPIGATTFSLVSLGIIVSDRETNALSDFMVSPIKRNTLFASYLLSSFILGFIILMLFVLLFEFYFVVTFGASYGFTVAQFGLILATMLGSLLFSNVFMLLIMSFVKSQQSLGAVGTILGTLLGFISGGYMPIGMFGETIGSIFTCLPFFQITVLFREAFLHNFEEKTAITAEMMLPEIKEEFGISAVIFGNGISIPMLILISSLVTIALLIVTVIRFNKMKKAD